MTTSPATTLTDELVAELEASASYCVTEVIRSHSWSEQEFDLLRADERYVRAASPELLVALLAERAELKMDAERYRYIVKWLSHYGAGSSRGVCMPSDYSSSTKEQCDESIDTAIKQQKEPAQ